ncbi:hypothetical protein AAHA92_02302 [Salvia divinorum]|uniref:Uncharacterized protein n=1 Tax=Salvia divinorum TaxID=28513 RepID=A0ABD1IE07_SALDI
MKVGPTWKKPQFTAMNLSIRPTNASESIYTQPPKLLPFLYKTRIIRSWCSVELLDTAAFPTISLLSVAVFATLFERFAIAVSLPEFRVHFLDCIRSQLIYQLSKLDRY